MPFLVSISNAFKLLGSDIVVEVLTEWISPSLDLLEVLSIVRLLSSNVVVWSVWLVWSEGLLVACSSV